MKTDFPEESDSRGTVPCSALGSSLASLVTFAVCCTAYFAPLSCPPRSFAAGEIPTDTPASASAESVDVNRTVPQVAPPPAALAFSDAPSEQEIFEAHLFEEPLIPVGGKSSAAENKELAAALLAYAGRTSNDDVSTITTFLDAHPASAWRVALYTDLGIVYRHTGRFTKALDAWEKAWNLGKNATDPRESALVDRAWGELARMNAHLGWQSRVETLLADAASRKMTGAGGVLRYHTERALEVMRDRPEVAFRCGPVALSKIAHFLNPSAGLPRAIFEARATRAGTSLSYLVGLAKQIGLDYQMAYRENSTEIPTPCMACWKTGHYAAIVTQKNGVYVSQDPSFGNDLRISQRALDEESSGYFLIPAAHCRTVGVR